VKRQPRRSGRCTSTWASSGVDGAAAGVRRVSAPPRGGSDRLVPPLSLLTAASAAALPWIGDAVAGITVLGGTAVATVAYFAIGWGRRGQTVGMRARASPSVVEARPKRSRDGEHCCERSSPSSPERPSCCPSLSVSATVLRAAIRAPMSPSPAPPSPGPARRCWAISGNSSTGGSRAGRTSSSGSSSSAPPRASHPGCVDQARRGSRANSVSRHAAPYRRTTRPRPMQATPATATANGKPSESSKTSKAQ
jgi:hypothetical protein